MESENGERAVHLLKRVSSGVAVFSVACLVAAQFGETLAAVGIGGLIVSAASAVGAGLGFLFAVPRVLSLDPKEDLGSGVSAKGEPRKRLIVSNTNLERISDWLTTMFVGLGLMQLTKVGVALNGFSAFLEAHAKVYRGSAGNTAGILPAIGPLLLLFGLVFGFISFYLITRLWLSPVFHSVERDLSSLLPEDGSREVKNAANALGNGGKAENPVVQAVLNSNRLSIDSSLNFMHTLLYRPKGYQQVIDLGGKLSNTAIRERAEFWFYLAAAFGQKYSALRQKGAAEEELRATEINALDCAGRAVQIDDTYRRRLLQISNPDGPDDDLKDFRENPRFKSIVRAN